MGGSVIEDGNAKNRQKIIAVCGVKNSGKTTLIEKLLTELSRKGIKAAVIKHDGHDFSCDVPGTDSYRFQKAGAYGTAVFSKYRMFVQKEGCGETEQELIRQFPEAEIILLEGMKDSAYPKIEVIRKVISDRPVSNPQGRFLIVTDWEEGKFAERSVGLEDVEEIVKLLTRIIEGKNLTS